MNQIEYLGSKVWGYVGTPFETMESFTFAAIGALMAVGNLTSKTGWLYLLSSIVLGALIYVYSRHPHDGNLRPGSLREFLFPKSVFLHRSALVDYRFVLVDLTVKSILYTPLITGFSYLTYLSCVSVAASLKASFPQTAPITLDPVLLAVVAFMAGDFCFFFAHFLMHKVKTLWCFHEVHHSAEVLTPVTVYRTHPVEDLVNGIVSASVFGLAAGVYAASNGQEIGLPTIFGVNIVMFLFFSVGFQLRHSHIWLSYGRFWSHVLISPAQHQIHHSSELRHWDKNFGFVFAIWDVLFRTLYVPGARETFKLGVPNADPADFAGVGKLYWLPFVKAFRGLRKGSRQRDVVAS